jgi:hypothetical protein
VNRPASISLPPLLELSSSQVEIALQNAASQVDRLAASVAAFVKVGAEMCAHPDAAVAAYGVRVTVEAQRAIFAMQFHDVLTQRLQHVRDGLGDLQDALAAPTAPAPEVLLSAIRARLTMEDERRLFDTLLGHVPGAPPASADTDHESLRGSVELF